MKFNIKVGGTWRTVNQVYVNQGGVWRAVSYTHLRAHET
jgi:hypothetical protein